MPETDFTPPVGSRPIQSDPAYRVTDDGVVWSSVRPGGWPGMAPWHVIKVSKLKSGYILVNLRSGKARRTHYVHRLVLEAFVGPCPPGMECCHNDGNRANNHVLNLRWDTRTNNHADKKKHGTRNCGERSGTSKLKDSDIVEIFRLSRSGLSYAKIAKIQGVTFGNIGQIIRRKTWSHVPVPSEYLPIPR